MPFEKIIMYETRLLGISAPADGSSLHSAYYLVLLLFFAICRLTVKKGEEAEESTPKRHGGDQLDQAEGHYDGFTSLTNKATVFLRGRSVGSILRALDSNVLCVELYLGIDSDVISVSVRGY